MARHARIAGLAAVAVVAVPVVGAGCKDDGPPRLKWLAHEMKSAKLGPFTIDHPPGWRDLMESKDPNLARMSRRVGPNAHILVRETDRNTDTNIALDWTEDVPNFRNVTCAHFAQGFAMAGAGAPVLTEVAFGADRGCAWSSDDDGTHTDAWVRFHEDSFLTLICMRPSAGDAHADAVCAGVVAALRAQ